MIIEIEIPDWANKDHLFLFHGMELVAVKRQIRGEADIPWVLKDGRCSRCGTCCETKHVNSMPLPTKNGRCIHLRKREETTSCAWDEARPFCCCIGEPKFEPKCTITWRQMGEKVAADA